MASSAANPAAGAWDFECLGKRLPRSLRQARDLSTARRIVATAEKIFADQGLAGARMDEIARAAKVNKALLYYYFRSKEELYRFVLETLLSQLQVSAAGRLDADHARQRLARGDRSIFSTSCSGIPNYPRLVQREMMSRGPNLEWIVSEYYRPLQRQLVRIDRRRHLREANSGAWTRGTRRSPWFPSWCFIFGRAVLRPHPRARSVESAGSGATAAKPSTISSNTGCFSPRAGSAMKFSKFFLFCWRLLFVMALVVYFTTTPRGNRNSADGHRHRE